MKIQLNTPKELLKIALLFPEGHLKVIGEKSFWIFFSLKSK